MKTLRTSWLLLLATTPTLYPEPKPPIFSGEAYDSQIATKPVLSESYNRWVRVEKIVVQKADDSELPFRNVIVIKHPDHKEVRLLLKVHFQAEESFQVASKSGKEVTLIGFEGFQTEGTPFNTKGVLDENAGYYLGKSFGWRILRTFTVVKIVDTTVK